MIDVSWCLDSVENNRCVSVGMVPVQGVGGTCVLPTTRKTFCQDDFFLSLWLHDLSLFVFAHMQQYDFTVYHFFLSFKESAIK